MPQTTDRDGLRRHLEDAGLSPRAAQYTAARILGESPTTTAERAGVTTGAVSKAYTNAVDDAEEGRALAGLLLGPNYLTRIRAADGRVLDEATEAHPAFSLHRPAERPDGTYSLAEGAMVDALPRPAGRGPGGGTDHYLLALHDPSSGPAGGRAGDGVAYYTLPADRLEDFLYDWVARNRWQTEGDPWFLTDAFDDDVEAVLDRPWADLLRARPLLDDRFVDPLSERRLVVRTNARPGRYATTGSHAGGHLLAYRPSAPELAAAHDAGRIDGADLLDAVGGQYDSVAEWRERAATDHDLGPAARDAADPVERELVENLRPHAGRDPDAGGDRDR